MVKEDKYYKILDVEIGADQEAIRKAYKRQSLRWHPDKNNGNKEEAEARFKEIAEAYEVLRDPETRSKYDRYGEAAFKGGDYDTGFERGHFDHNYHFRAPEDIFREFFGMESFFGGHSGHGGRRGMFDDLFSMHAGMMHDMGRDPHPQNMGGHPFSGDPFFSDPFFSGGFPGFSQGFSSNMSSFMGGGMSGGMGGGMGGTSVSKTVRIVNGARYETTETVDAAGNRTVVEKGPDGVERVVSGGNAGRIQSGPSFNSASGGNPYPPTSNAIPEEHGKRKRASLYVNLVDNSSEDEIKPATGPTRSKKVVTEMKKDTELRNEQPKPQDKTTDKKIYSNDQITPTTTLEPSAFSRTEPLSCSAQKTAAQPVVITIPDEPIPQRRSRKVQQSNGADQGAMDNNINRNAYDFETLNSLRIPKPLPLRPDVQHTNGLSQSSSGTPAGNKSTRNTSDNTEFGPNAPYFVS